MKKVLYGLLGWAIGGTLGWLALRGIDWGDALGGMRQVEWSAAFLAVAAIVFSHYLKAYRWKSLLPNEDISPGRLFVIHSAAQGLNSLSPVKVFSEVTQLTLLTKRHQVPAPRAIASLLHQNLQDMLVTGTILGVGLLTIPALAGYRTIMIASWGVGIGLFLLTPLAARLALRVSWCRAHGFVENTLSATQYAQGRKRAMAAGLFFTLAAWAYLGIAAWLVGLAVGVTLPFWQMLVVMVVVTRLAGFIPSPPGGIGVFEFVAVSALGLFAIDQSTALTFALVIHAIIFVPPLLIAAIVVVTERSTFTQALSSLAAPMRQMRRPLRAEGSE